MARGVAVLVALVALVAGFGSRVAGAAPATSTTALPPPPAPKAWVLVDADTGAVLEGGNDRTPLRVASVLKLLTALVVAEHLAPDDDVPVSARAEGMPARRIQLKQGEVWRVDHLLHALLLVSANDAAVALAERAGGSLEGFGELFVSTALRLGMADDPVLRDPAGLDDEFSVAGGNLVSARDLAIATRAFLAHPELASVVTMPESRFVGGDGEPHHLRNHNRLLRLYPGALGVKTGYTRRAGHSLVAAARRDDRTMIAVVVGAPDPYRSATSLLDRGFSVPVDAQGGLDRLPRVAPELRKARSPGSPVAAPSAEGGTGRGEAEPRDGGALVRDVVVLVVGSAPAVAILVKRRRLDRGQRGRSRTRGRVAA